jgi:ABC-type oligopeptide transport system substrate-binding subunit
MARVRKGDFDLALMAWQGSPNEEPGLQFASTGPFNFWGYRSSATDSLLEALRRAPPSVDRLSLLQSLAGALARDQPVIFLYRFDVPALIARRVHDVSAVADRLDLRRAWLDP